MLGTKNRPNCGRNICWEGWGSDWTASTLLMNMIISWTQCNSKTCAYALTNDGVQLILAHNHSIMPGYRALTRILTNFHIFACSAHIAMIFTSLETRSSPLSYYIHSISLCCPSLVSAWLCMALLMRALTNLQHSSHQPPRHATTHCRCREAPFFRSLVNM